MDQRYFLRFESGERKGETIPIPASGLTIGRRPGHTLQITDSSVSGNHAELRIAGGQVLLKDLGSTNGTRVEGQRVQEQRLQPGERCASTSNRNFEGRQGAGGRTHLVSPPMAAAAAIAGHFVAVGELGADVLGRNNDAGF